MRKSPSRLTGLVAALLLAGAGIAVTWLAASAALSGLRPDALAATLGSSQVANYGASHTDVLVMPPLDADIAASAAGDRQRSARKGDHAEAVFTPIFLVGEGNQQPVRLPSGEAQPPAQPTPKPSHTPNPLPTEPDLPTPKPSHTPEPEPTQPDAPTPKPTHTPKPQPTQPDLPTPKPTHTPKPQPTQPDVPTAKPTNTPKPQPTQPDAPTPKPTRTPKP